MGIRTQHFLFDWGDTLMVDIPGQTDPMCDWSEDKLIDAKGDFTSGENGQAHYTIHSS